MPRSYLLLVFLTALAFVTTACSVGPKYQKPAVQVPAGYKELNGWKVAQPSDAVPRDKWWEIFQDAQLNALAEQINVSNQTLAIAEAQLRGARAAVNVARAALFPTITGRITLAGSRQSLHRTGASDNASEVPRADYILPAIEMSYEADVWGRIRHNVAANIASAQASAADLETARLSLQAELAVNYFTLLGLDAQKQLLDFIIAAFERALELTTNRYNQGVASQIEVLQARTQLESTRAQAIDVGVQRARFEHAIAILLGKAPAEFSLPPTAAPVRLPEIPAGLSVRPADIPGGIPILMQPPPIPVGLPSELLERRPDIAAAERRVVTANEQIGIAQAAFFPTVTLTSALGLESSSLTNLFSLPSVLWSLGSTVTQIAFDAGRRKAVSEQAQAAYDATVATYRQTVLTAFQGVEDNLAALRILEEEALQQDKAVRTAETTLIIALNRYRGGVTTYLEVVTAQSAALTAARTAVDLWTRRMTAAILLVRALGGGWQAASN
ncbi:MAG TPA: efflux transporter outer membrane subunit [Candidatus Tectomicrobia bacterium]|jgi:NodT family efflux transporter outer membrane factor (OMF) lipoprotein